MKPRVCPRAHTQVFAMTKREHGEDHDKEKDQVLLLLTIAILVHGAMYGESYFETQGTNLNAYINQGVFEATKNYFRADDMTSAQEKLFKFNHPAGRGLDQSTINIQDKLAFQSGGEYAKDATSSSSIIQPHTRSGGVLTMNVTSLIESGSAESFE